MGIRSCLLKQRKYDANGISVRCYDGWWKHSLYINDELVDQLSAPCLLVPWKLTYRDSHFYEATFSPSHSITLKVDGRLVQPLD